MALIKAGRPENDKGTKFPVGVDPDTHQKVSLGIRAVPEAQARKIAQGYGFEKEVDVPYEDEDRGTKRRMVAHLRKRVHSEDDWRLIQRDKALWAWVSSENLEILATDDEQAQMYTRLLGVPVEANKPFCVDAHLTPAFKSYVLDNDTPLAKFIVERSDELGKREYGKEASLRGN